MWINNANWSNGVPGTGDSVLLTNAGAPPSTQNVSIGGAGLTSLSLNPNAAGYAINITAATGIPLQPGSVLTDNNTLAADTFTGVGGLKLNGLVTVTTVAGAGLTFQTIVSDGAVSGSLTKTGAGTLTLSSNANTYTGGTAINGGTLQATSDFSLGASGTGLSFDGGTLAFIGGPTGGISRPITLNAGGGTIDTTLGSPTSLVGDITGPGSLTKVGTGTLELFGNNTYSGATNVNAGTLSVGFDTGLPSTTAVKVNSGATLSIADNVQATIGSLADGTSGGGNVVIGPTAAGSGTTLAVGGTGASTTFSGAITGAGSLLLDGAGTLILTGTGNNIGGDIDVGSCGCSVAKLKLVGGSFVVGGSTTIEDGKLEVSNAGTLTTQFLGVAGAMTIDGAGSNVTVTNTLPNSPASTTIGFLGPGTLTISNGGVLNSLGTAEIDGLVGTPSATVTGTGSQWNIGGPFTVGDGTFGGPGKLTIASGGAVNVTGSFMHIGDGFDGSSLVTVTGTGSALSVSNDLKIGADCGCTVGTLTIADGGAVTAGSTKIRPGSTLNLGTGGLAGSITTPAITNDGQIVANFTDALTLAAAISGSGILSKAGAGTLTLSGISTYTGPTSITGGTLAVTGSITSDVTIGTGATLKGTGSVGGVTVNAGGTLAPGSSPGTLTVTGSLAMVSTAIYLVQVSPATASKTNVGGSAAVGGTVDVVAGGGSYAPGTKYTILTTTGGPVTGTFSGVSVVGGSFGPGIAPKLSYDTNDVFLTLAQASLAPLLPPNLSGNQQSVANAINAFINAGGVLPPGFQNLYNLSPSQLAQALTQLEGQNNAGGGQTAGFQLTNQFLLLMLNPFDADRGGGFGAGGFGVSRFAPERELPPDVALAYAAVTPAGQRAIAYAPRWNIWAAAYGGNNNTNGDPNGTGSVNFSARTGGVAAGIDYKLTPDTLLGFALAGGGTSWGLAQGLGGGRSDAFQAGLYGSQQFGPWYLSGAAAFANYWASTSRTITLPAVDTLNASFNAQSWGGRIEAGYKLPLGIVNLAPYAAFQAQSFSTPNYSETSTSGSQQFALSYAARTGSVTRAELGSWANNKYLIADTALLNVFGRAAWAHDWQHAPQASATFLGLAPIASFIANGAKPATDLAVVTAGAEIRMASGWAFMGKLDGEFGNGTQTYVGTGRARYAW